MKPTKVKPKSAKPEWQQINFVRLPNAPSIPSHNLVFGYEETESFLNRWRIDSTAKS